MSVCVRKYLINKVYIKVKEEEEKTTKYNYVGKRNLLKRFCLLL